MRSRNTICLWVWLAPAAGGWTTGLEGVGFWEARGGRAGTFPCAHCSGPPEPTSRKPEAHRSWVSLPAR